MKNKVLLLLMTIMCVASLCMGCATENIIPKEDKSPDDSKETAVNYEVDYEIGYLELDSKCFMEKTNPVVLYANTYEECQELIDHQFLEQIEKMDRKDPYFQQRYDDTKKYTEEFFAEKELIVLVWYLPDGTNCKYSIQDFTYVKEEGKEPSYCIKTEFDPNAGGADVEGSFYKMYAIEVDKSLGITPENLTVEVIDKTK